jgi:hypothetical protein
MGMGYKKGEGQCSLPFTPLIMKFNNKSYLFIFVMLAIALFVNAAGDDVKHVSTLTPFPCFTLIYTVPTRLFSFFRAASN